MTDNVFFLASYAVLWAVVGFQTLLLIGLTTAVLRGTEGQGAHRNESAVTAGLALGSEAPAFAARDLDGNVVTNSTLRGQLSALLFVQPRCQTCMTTLRELDMLSDKALGRITVVCGGDPAECERIRQRYGLLLPFVPDTDKTIFDAFKVDKTPFAVLLDELGRVESTGRPRRPDDLDHDSVEVRAAAPTEAHAR